MKENNAYEIIKTHSLKDLKTEGTLLRHKKSGARILCLSNDDPNKVFYIGFRTPVNDSTGVPHIIEHTVLCGSEKYPVKDPFVELVKGSLNTFLNAMTYPDKTVYPVASENDQDFKNLCDVYLDAVFHPNIYHHEEIFQQEGWHYELESEESPLTINGVVYNEMKGAFSSPDDVLSRQILNSLHPDTTYAFESGGDPEVIPELTYEDYLDFHRRYYHPVNSYIYFYGDMDMDERLEWLDQAYLSKYEKIEVDSAVERQKSFDAMQEKQSEYNIAEGTEEKENTYLSLNYSVGTTLDRELYVAFDILDYALMSMPGAPVKQALLDAGIGKDVYGGYDPGTFQPIFSVIAKNAESSQKDEFLKIIKETLKKVVSDGIDQKALLAGINSSEFRYREADFGTYPKGLIYGLQVLDSWLYDETEPFMHLEALPTYAFLREQIGKTRYFEELVEKYLIDNPHATLVVVTPKKGLAAEGEEKLRKILEEKKAGLSGQEIKEMVQRTAALKAYQEEPSSPEDLMKLPMLKREDIRRTPRPIQNEEFVMDGVKGLFHDISTNGIAYLHLYFELPELTLEEVPYLQILRSTLGFMNTEHYSYSDLSNEINLYTGGIGMNGSISVKMQDYSRFLYFEARAKALYENLDKSIELLREIMYTTDFSDDKRLKEIILEGKSRLALSMSARGHITSSTRAMSYFSESAKVSEQLSGIGMYRFLKDLEENFEERKEGLKAKLKSLCEMIFVKKRMMISFTADRDGLDRLKKSMPILMDSMKEGSIGEKAVYTLEKRNEGFLDASQVQYVSRAGSFLSAGPYKGTLRILRTILNYDYLWLNLRVKGGAYGCMSSFARHGDAWLASYRDPNLSETNEVYEGIPAYLRDFTADEREMTKYIIGTISEMDTPLNPDAKGERSAALFLSGVTEEELQKDRNEILNATEKDIQEMAKYIDAILEGNHICAIGNENVIGKEEKMFSNKEALL